MPRPSWFNRPTTYSTCSCGPGHQDKGNNGTDYLCPVCTVHKPVFMFKLVWSNHMHCGLRKAVSKAYLGRLHSSLIPRPPFNTARGGLHIGGVHTVVSSLDPPSTLQEEGLGTRLFTQLP